MNLIFGEGLLFLSPSNGTKKERSGACPPQRQAMQGTLGVLLFIFFFLVSVPRFC